MAMAMYKITGNVDKRGFEDMEITWKISDFFSIAKEESAISSPPFTYAGITWYLHLYLKPILQNLRLYLMKRGNLECSVQYVFGLKKRDGTTDCSSGGFMKNKSLSDPCLLNLLTIHQRRTELAPLDVLHIMCRMKSLTTLSGQEGMLEQSNIMKKLKSMDTLSENFKTIFLNKHSCDITLYVMEKEFQAHKFVLIARSPVFSAMFLHETAEKHTGIITISDCDSESFDKFLEFLYCGKIEEISTQDALPLYETSHKYDVRDLKELCREYLKMNLTLENLFDVVTIADKYDDSTLSSVAQDCFNKNLKDILKTSEWHSLVKNNYPLSQKLLEEMASKVIILQ